MATPAEGFTIGMLLAVCAIAATTTYFLAVVRAARVVALGLVSLVVLASGILVSAVVTPAPGGQPTPAPVESGRSPMPTCPSGTLGPQWLDRRWVCIPYDQAG